MASSEPLPVGTPDAGSASLHWHLPRRRSGAADAGRYERINKDMQNSFYIMIGFMIVVGGIIIGFAVFIGRSVKAKSRRMLDDMRRDNAIVQSECMIRDGSIQCPGAALVADGDLVVKSVFGKTRQIPISKVSVLKEGLGPGKFGWFGKRVFYLNTLETTNLAIGVKDPEPWRRAFAKQKDSYSNG